MPEDIGIAYFYSATVVDKNLYSVNRMHRSSKFTDALNDVG